MIQFQMNDTTDYEDNSIGIDEILLSDLEEQLLSLEQHSKQHVDRMDSHGIWPLVEINVEQMCDIHSASIIIKEEECIA